MRNRFSTYRSVKLLFTLLVLLAIVILFTAVAAASGTHTGGHSHGQAGHHAGGLAFGKPGKASQASHTVEIIATDIDFNPSKIQVESGETIRFVVYNRGKLLHEFNIGTPAMHAAHQKEMQMMMEHGMMTATGMRQHMENREDREDREEMEEMNHLGMHMPMQHDDPNAILLEPGETKELVWTFEKTQFLEFACNVPGHYEAGMVGQITFDEKGDAEE